MPTLREQGFPFDASFWLGLYGPKGMTRDVASRIANDVGKVLEAPTTKAQLDAMGLSPRGTAPHEMARLMEVEERYYRDAARLAGIAGT